MNETIRLKGFGMTKGVFLNGTSLNSERVFDWGYMNDGAINLATAVLEEVAITQMSTVTIKDFAATIISQIPYGNFDVEIDFKRWLGAADHKGKMLTAPLFMKVHIGNDVMISKFIDFPNLDIKSGLFDDGTIEYDTVKNMTQEEFNQFAEYLVSKTTRKSLEDPKKDIQATLELVDGLMTYTNGLGSKTLVEGHKKSEYEY